MKKIKSIIHDKEIIQKLWQAFRIGQTTYIAYIIGLINFTLILYRLAGIDQYIEPFPFALILIAILLPTGILVGVMHIRKQIPIEAKIMTHHNPYIYKVIPASKESMAVKTTLWNFDQVKVANDFIEFQADMNKKLWEGMNKIAGEEIFTKDDMDRMDAIKEQAKTIKIGADDWKTKYDQLYDGKMTKDISGADNPVELK